MHTDFNVRKAIAAVQSPFRIVPIGDDFLQRVRAGTDDLGQAVEHHIAEGGEPLRDCLRRARPGEAILLASFSPFGCASPYREYGPVFIAAAPQPAPTLERMPFEGDGAYLGPGFVLRAYSAQERIVDAKLTSPASFAEDLDVLFAQPEVSFVLARFTLYGCYALRLECASGAG